MRQNTTSFSEAGGSNGVVPLCSLSFLMLLIITTQAVAQSIVWTTQAPMPTPRIDFGVAAVNDKIYAIGGFSGSTLSTVEEYDPSNDTWMSKAAMPTPRRLLVVTSVRNKIYAIGGMRFIDPNTVTYSRATEEYDPRTDTWTSKAAIPIPPAFNNVLGNLFIGGASAHGKIYVMVFNTTISGTTATYEYDPIADSWDTTKAPVPFSDTRFSAVSFHDKLYVLATDTMSGDARLAEYDPTTDIWTIRPTVPTRRRLLSIAATQDKLYAIGGLESFDPSTVVPTVEEFDPSSNRWVNRTPMHTARHSAGLGTVHGKIYVIGGADATSVPLSVVEEGRVPLRPPPPPRVGGRAIGVSPRAVLCRNLTTGQTVQIELQENRSWNCRGGGLVVNTGDRIRQTVTGRAD